ncbi:MAG: hypothetical protein WBK26_02500 [Burkholderiaceae bacterium]
MSRLRAHCLAAGVTGQELATILGAVRNPEQAARAIALHIAQLQDDG